MHFLRYVRRMFMAATLALPLAAQAVPESFAPMIEPLMPAVVNISTTQKVQEQAQQMMPLFDFNGLPDNPQTQQFKQLFKQFNQQGQPVEREVSSLGSGFVIDAEGYVVTNNHVVGNADEITVIFQDNTRLPATIVGRDAKTDLALLKVKSDKKLTAVSFGDSDALKVGDWVVAVGNPFGLGGSVSAGIVSARGRNINAGPFDDFIQTDAAINRGNSGGPLFNAKGEVVGVNSAIFSPTGTNIGIGFAVPSAMVKLVTDQLREFGTIHRGWLGVKIQEVSDEIADSLKLGKPRGALVLEISKDSPAVGSGLIAGDVIVKYDGKPVNEMRQLPRYVADTKAGKTVELTVWRKGREVPVKVTIGELPEDKDALAEAPLKDGKQEKGKPGAPAPEPVLGMGVTPLTPALRKQFNLPPSVKGMLVTELDRAGEAAKRGMQPGDVILEANQNPVESIAALKQALADAKKAGNQFALLRVQRGENAMFVTLAMK